MNERLSPSGGKALRRFLALLGAACAVQAAAQLCLSLEGEGAVPLYALCMYALLPAAAILVPWWAALGGVHPLAACLPIGGLPLLFSPLTPLPCLISIVLSLVSAAAGQEWKKRSETEEPAKHGRNRK